MSRSSRPAAKKAPAKKASIKTGPDKKGPDKTTPVKKTPAKRVRATTSPTVTAPLPRALREMYTKHSAGMAPIWDPATGLTVDINVPSSTTLAPQRTRCKTCRSGLGNLVVLQMFCSYTCAGLPEPDDNPSTAPRICKRAARSDEQGEWVLKTPFPTAAHAQPYLRPGTTLYRCSNCFFLHIGNVSAPPKPGLPSGPPGSTGNLFADGVAAVLRARGESPESGAAVAAAKRDVRAVLEVLVANKVRTRAALGLPPARSSR